MFVSVNPGDVSSDSNSSTGVDDTEVRVRKYGEAVVNTLSSVASVLEYPKCMYIILFSVVSGTIYVHRIV